MNLNSLTAKAKDLFSKRGGAGALKEDAQELKDIATGKGSAGDKAKAAVEALKDPGAPGPDRGTPGAPGPGRGTPGATERDRGTPGATEPDRGTPGATESGAPDAGTDPPPRA